VADAQPTPETTQQHHHQDGQDVPPRLDLVAHVRELIGDDPEGYVRRRLPYVVGRLVADVSAAEPGPR